MQRGHTTSGWFPSVGATTFYILFYSLIILPAVLFQASLSIHQRTVTQVTGSIFPKDTEVQEITKRSSTYFVFVCQSCRWLYSCFFFFFHQASTGFHFKTCLKTHFITKQNETLLCCCFYFDHLLLLFNRLIVIVFTHLKKMRKDKERIEYF